MRFSRDFINITLADFIVRSAYQMGKTPLLPIFAATLGASGVFLGFIVSVSTMTGLVLKPLIGILSDRWGRRVWLIVGTAFFVGMPFLYRFVHSPQHLMVMRVVHGFATAVYGPVTLAYIAELTPQKIAESLGWFGLARSGGYIIGPALAGWLLLYIDPVQVFTIIGLISCIAIVPILSLANPPVNEPRKSDKSLPQQIIESVHVAGKTPAIWLAGMLEASVFIALYATKAFLPVFALSAGINVALVGLFFSVQEAVNILVKPFGGRVGDRYGHIPAIAIGMTLLGIGLGLLPTANGVWLLVPSVLTGMAQALIFPSTVALASHQVDRRNLGAGMGFIGMMDNFGKVVGPICGGFFIERLGFEPVLYALAVMLILGGLLLQTISRKPKDRDPHSIGDYERGAAYDNA